MNSISIASSIPLSEISDIYSCSPQRIRRDAMLLFQSPFTKKIEISFTTLTLNDGTHYKKVLSFKGDLEIQRGTTNCSLPVEMYLPPGALVLCSTKLFLINLLRIPKLSTNMLCSSNKFNGSSEKTL